MHVHDSEPLARFLEVRVDGDDVSADCMVADSDSGWVRLCRRDDDGKENLDPATGEPQSFPRYGLVTIVDKRTGQAATEDDRDAAEASRASRLAYYGLVCGSRSALR